MKSILLTGGVGDVLAIESLMTKEERQSINAIYYATRAYKPCMELFENHPAFPNLKKQTAIWKDFTRIFCFHNKNHIADKLCAYQPNALQGVVRKLMESIEDYSIEVIFKQNRTYKYSSFISLELADIGKFNLPKQYCCICPYSSNDKRDIRRDYDYFDWVQTLSILKRKKLQGVVINVGSEIVPNDPTIINLSNKTNIREAIEIVKQAQGYIGIDTAFSVIAAKVFKPENIIIKSLNDHCLLYAHIYFTPFKKFDFLKNKIKDH